ncbi:alpha-tocopherol transfer protein [Stomoxys calcitrans]|uniref:alpha-tocopherol transfer protein n=1 Tax=Stomoxys calcitrans TaxID=35570 RepID=UPI0027E2C81E|nr:alpha-tocopherol transfer protein [Stomoxys calcitrans]XP_013115258.2 alpha-tocopherol transfer protein [Stomoxys calcitrans]
MPSFEYELNMDPELPDDIKKVAIEQGECEETRIQTIEEFRNYILEHDKCQPHRTDDEFLIRYLRARFWNIPQSYKLLCNYYKFREQNKNFFEKVRPLDLTYIASKDIVHVTPYRDQCGRRIMIYRFGVWKPSEVTTDDIFRATVCLMEMGILEPITQVVGGIGIFDLQGFSLSHLLHLSPSVATKMIAVMVTSMPTRVASIHIVNQNFVFKPFMDAKMREHLFIHGSDMTSLHKHIRPDCLPKRYGGELEDFSCTAWIESIKENQHIQKELEKQGYVI